MNVLHVISGIDPENGGPTRALLGLAAAQVKLGTQVRVVTTFRQPTGPANAPSFETAGVPVTLIGPAWGAPSWHPSIGSVLRRLITEADVVHIHAMFEEIQHQAAKIARKLKKPYIIRPCGGLDPWALARGRLKKQLYLALRLRRDLNGASAIHYTTNAERRAAAPLGLTAETVVEPNGIDLTEFDPLPEKGAFRARHPDIAGRLIFLYLGRLDPKKGLDLLIPAFASANIPNAVLVLAGPDSANYRQTLLKLAQDQRIANRVIFPGMQHGLQRIEALVDADLFIMPSHVENFGISVIEAMAAGKPVIMSENVNLANDLPHGAAQIVPLNIAALAASLKVTPTASQTMLAADFVRQTFAWPRIAQAWAAHYVDLITQAAL